MESGCFYNPNPKPTGRCLKDTTSNKVDSKCEKTESGCKVITSSLSPLPTLQKSPTLPPLSTSNLPLPVLKTSTLQSTSPKTSPKSSGKLGKISGPMSAYSLHANGKSINLFGDAHFSLQGTCKPCQDINLNTLKLDAPPGSEDCYDVSVLLSNIFTKASKEKKWVDFYIEIPFIKGYYPEEDAAKEAVYKLGYLYKLYYIFYNCMNKLKCQYDTTRFHYVDVRLEYQKVNLPKMTEELEKLIMMTGMEKPLAFDNRMITFESYVSINRLRKSLEKFAKSVSSGRRESIPFLENTDKLMKELYFSGGQTMQGKIEPKNYLLLKLYLTSDDFYEDATKLFDLSFLKDQNEFITANYHLTVPTLLVNRRGKNMHRIRAQLEALENEGQGEMANKIVKFILEKYLKKVDNSKIMDLWKGIMISYDGYLNNKFRSINDLSNLMGKFFEEFERMNKLVSTSITGTALLLDAYTLARMFRTYPGKNHVSSSKDIIYAGNAHIDTYVDFFEEFQIPIKKYQPNKGLKLTDTNSVIRCIDNVDLSDFTDF